ncbi:MAG: hypothetical protein V3V78_03690, partial [Candidatus Woesearchaeota archaeon]
MTQTPIPPDMPVREKDIIRKEASNYIKIDGVSILNLNINDFFGYLDTYGRQQGTLAVNAVDDVFVAAADNILYSAMYNREGKFLLVVRNPEKTIDYLKQNIEDLTIPKHEPDEGIVIREYDGKEVV